MKLHNGAVPTILVDLLLIAAVLFTGCSVYMEANRPTPVDLAQFQTGQARDSVLEQVGAPKSSVIESDGASCDFYELYTHGYGAGGKVPIAFLEGAADVVTLGLAEVVATPVEGATKNKLRPVVFCYKDSKLLRIAEAGSVVSGSGPSDTVSSNVSPAPTPAAQASATMVAAAPAPSAIPSAGPSAAASPGVSNAVLQSH